MDISKGRYWDKGVQAIDGCTPCSPGCDNCWSAGIAHRFKREGEPCQSSGILTDQAGRFNGDIITWSDRLDVFRKTRKPTVFAIWNDLFHEYVPFNFIHEVYGAMRSNYHHTYLILSKRPQRMFDVSDLIRRKEALANANGWFNHIYHGLTVCNQQEADEKIPIFLHVPGKKFLSIEPMLGPIDLKNFFWTTLNGEIRNQNEHYAYPHPISSVILGGETGPKARPLHPDWVRSIRDQCAAAGVNFFFKQWGEFAPEESVLIDGSPFSDSFRRNAQIHICERGERLYRVGRKKAGCLLDGKEHNNLPWGEK